MSRSLASGMETRVDAGKIRPLSDPVRILVVFTTVWSLLCGAGGLAVGRGGNFMQALPLFIQALWILPTAMLPFGKVQALFLRAFGHDVAGEYIKAVVEASLVPERMRLSGIRPPSKRVPMILRPILTGYLLIRYAGSRFMSLEAGHDWLARLWRTLADIRIVFVDLTIITDNLRAEIRLCHRALGMQRMVFITNGQATEHAAISEVAAWLGESPEAIAARVAPWNGPWNVESFYLSIRSFIDALPPGVPGLCAAAKPLVAEYFPTKRRYWLERLGGISALIIGSALSMALGQLFGALRDPRNVESMFDSGWLIWVYGSFFACLSGVIAAVCLTFWGRISGPEPALARWLRARSFRVLARNNMRQPSAKTVLGGALAGALFFAIQVPGILAYRQGKHLAETFESTMSALRMLDEMTATRYMRQLSDAVVTFRAAHGRIPTRAEGLSVLLPAADAGLIPQRLRLDPWGHPYQYLPSSDAGAFDYVILSAGPDGRFATMDDIVVNGQDNNALETRSE